MCSQSAKAGLLWCNLFLAGALPAFAPGGLQAEGVCPLSGPGVSRAIGVIIGFESWPPDEDRLEPLLRKLEDAELELADAFERFKVWVFAWDSLQDGSRAENLCSELALDDGTSSLFLSCEPDSLLSPASAASEGDALD